MRDAPMLSQLYTVGSLTNDDGAVRFEIKNRLFDASVTGVSRVAVDGVDVPLDGVTLALGDHVLKAVEISPASPLAFPLRGAVDVRATVDPLGDGRHTIEVEFTTEAFGSLGFELSDTVAEAPPTAPTAGHVPHVPRDAADNYAPEIIEARQQLLRQVAGTDLHHVFQHSFDPHVTAGNIENFVGVAQVPIGLAGPLHVRGEHASGEFLIPLATAEGTLVASYNRGMKVINESGGAICTVSDDCMQRAPVFIFDSAREARAFRGWVEAHLAEIRHEAEATSRVAKLLYIDTYLSNKFAFLRFNFTTGEPVRRTQIVLYIMHTAPVP